MAVGIASLTMLKRADGDIPFDRWSVTCRTKAGARGITAETYTRIMRGVEPDTTGLEARRKIGMPPAER